MLGRMNNSDIREKKIHAIGAARRRLARLKVAVVALSVVAFSGLSAGIAVGTATASAATTTASTGSNKSPSTTSTTAASPTASATSSASSSSTSPARRHPPASSKIVSAQS